MMLEVTRSRSQTASNSNQPFGGLEQAGASAESIDVCAYQCVGVAARNRKNYCVHILRYVISACQPGASC